MINDWINAFCFWLLKKIYIGNLPRPIRDFIWDRGMQVK